MTRTGETKSRLAKSPPPNSIRYFRRKASLTRAEVGRRLGISGETIRKLEQGDIWLHANRAKELGRALDVPYELLGFSYAHDPYAWAAKALPVTGKVAERDEVKFAEIGFDIPGGAHFPEGCAAIDITVGKMRGWHLVYRKQEQQTISPRVVALQGHCERYLVHLTDGTTWWRHIHLSSTPDLYHLSSQYLDTINDTRVAWVSEIVGFAFARYALPTRLELDGSSPAFEHP